MSEEPPRRRRVTETSSTSSSGMIPTVALGIGVVVAGFGIGALISAYQARSASTTTTHQVARLPAVTPIPVPTRSEPAPTAAPTESPTPSPSPTPAPSPTRTKPPATASPRPTASAAPTASPHTTPSPHPKPTAPRSPAAVAVATPTPERVTPAPVAHTASPAPVRTVAAAPRETAAPANGAVALVRRYLTALIHGDEAAAYGALGGSAGDRGLTLSEQAFIDPQTRITAVRSTSTDSGGTNVEAELSSAKGAYYATFHVANGASGPYIDRHDYIKV